MTDWYNTTCRRTKDRKIPERVSVFITSSDESAQRATSDENWYEFRDFLVLKWCRDVVLPILLLQNSVKMASQIHCERTENIAQRTLYCNMLDCIYTGTPWGTGAKYEPRVSTRIPSINWHHEWRRVSSKSHEWCQLIRGIRVDTRGSYCPCPE